MLPEESRALPRGVVVATCQLVDCVRVESLGMWEDGWSQSPHAHGPWCWLLGDIQRLESSVPCSGRQRLWNLPSEVSALLDR